MDSGRGFSASDSFGRDVVLSRGAVLAVIDSWAIVGFSVVAGFSPFPHEAQNLSRGLVGFPQCGQKGMISRLSHMR